MSHCQATNQQQTFVHWNDTQKVLKTRYNQAQPHHGPHLQKNFTRVTGQL